MNRDRPKQYVNVTIDPNTWAEYQALKGQTGIERRLRHIAIFYGGKPTSQEPRSKITSVIHPMLVGVIPPGYAIGEPKYRNEDVPSEPASKQNPSRTGR